MFLPGWWCIQRWFSRLELTCDAPSRFSSQQRRNKSTWAASEAAVSQLPAANPNPENERIYTNVLVYLGSAVDNRNPPRRFPSLLRVARRAEPSRRREKVILRQGHPYWQDGASLHTHTVRVQPPSSLRRRQLVSASQRLLCQMSPLMNELDGRVDEECCYYTRKPIKSGFFFHLGLFHSCSPTTPRARGTSVGEVL